MGSLEGRPEKFHTGGGRGAKPWAGTLPSLDAKAKALKEEAEDRGGAGGRRRGTKTVSGRSACDRTTLSPSAPSSQVPKEACRAPHQLWPPPWPFPTCLPQRQEGFEGARVLLGSGRSLAPLSQISRMKEEVQRHP